VYGVVAALVGISGLLAHGGMAGAVVEASVALLVAAIAIAAWLGSRRGGEREER
jgi:hypothetical protein